MGISPNDGEKLIADTIRRIFSSAELQIISKIAARIKSPAPGEFGASQWEQSKLADLQALKGEIDDEVIGYLKDANPEVLEAVNQAYKNGQKAAVIDLEKLDQDVPVKGVFGKTDQRKVEKLAGAAINKLDDTHLRILRQTDDVYRQVIARATEGVTVGVDTRRQAAQSALNEFANRGITGFQDASGRSWNLGSYAEMATRSASGQAAIEGNMQRMKDNDHDLVMVSQHGEECELCRPWEGKVLSISGDNDQYPSVAEAEGDGLFHPNCAHNISAYVHGLSVTEDAEADPEGAEERGKQRYLERNVRKWKKRKAGALSEQEEQKAQNKISEWQETQRDFIEQTGRRRKYERESIDTAR